MPRKWRKPGGINPAQKRAWWPVLRILGRDWRPVCGGVRVRDSLKTKCLIELRDVAGIQFMRLTPAGEGLRDEWFAREARKLESQQRGGRG